MHENATGAQIVIYNLAQTLEVIGSPVENEIVEIVTKFLKAAKEVLEISACQRLCLFISPRDHDYASGNTPYNIPIQGKSYRKDTVLGVLWIGNQDLVVAHFPYSIYFTDSGVAFDIGSDESVEVAVRNLREVVINQNHIEVSSLSPPQDLVRRYILQLLSRSTRTFL